MAGDISIGKLFVELLVNDEKFGPALKGATAELNKLAAEAKKKSDEAARAVQPLATAFNVVTEAEKKHVAAIVASQAAETHRAAALGVTVGQLRQMDAALKAETASTTAATAAVKKHTTAVAAVKDTTAAAAGAASNLRFQIFDVVQQLSAGQNPLMIANQQGFQIAQAFGQPGAGGAMGLFTAALGPLGPLFTAAVGAAGPLVVIVGALATAYIVYANAAVDADEAATGAADRAVASAAKIAGTAADVGKANAAWGKFRDAVEDLSIELAAVDGELDEVDLRTIERTKKAREEAREGILMAAKQHTAAKLLLDAAKEQQYNDKAGHEARIKAALSVDELTKKEKEARKELEARKQALDDAIGSVLVLGEKERDAEEDEDGKKGKAKATRTQADATRDYAQAMAELSKSSEDAADKARLVSFGNLGDGGEVERTFRVSMEKSRQQAEKAVAEVEASFADALSAAAEVGGAAGEAMAEGARAALADARRAITDELIAAQDEAARKAEESQREAAAKRVEANASAISLQVGDEEQFADTMTKIREEVGDRLAELRTIDVDYARLGAEERVEVERKIQGEIEALREQAAEAEIKRARAVAKVNADVAKDVFSLTKQMVSDIYSFQKDEIADVTDLLEADVSVREKLANGEAVSSEERAKMLTATERDELEKRQAAAKEAALATFRVQQGLAVVSIAINTATAIVKALADLGPVAGGIAGVVIGGIGAVQAGLVLGQKEPEFHVGGVVEEEHRRRSPGRSTGRAVAAELEVGEGVLVSRAVQALGGTRGLERLNVDPVGAINSIAARVAPAAGVSAPQRSRFDARSVTSNRPPGLAADASGAVNGARAQMPPIVVVSKIGERTFDTIMADGLGGRRLPKVRSRLQRMTGVTAGLEG